jgi:hypothetical protein
MYRYGESLLFRAGAEDKIAKTGTFYGVLETLPF